MTAQDRFIIVRELIFWQKGIKHQQISKNISVGDTCCKGNKNSNVMGCLKGSFFFLDWSGSNTCKVGVKVR